MVNNVFIGIFFEVFFNCENFIIFDFSWNKLMGLIFVLVRLMVFEKMRVFILELNEIEGVILGWIWKSRNIIMLDLFNNKLFGEILRNLINMRVFIDNVIL